VYLEVLNDYFHELSSSFEFGIHLQPSWLFCDFLKITNIIGCYKYCDTQYIIMKSSHNPQSLVGIDIIWI
jgi:hypothetical protein